MSIASDIVQEAFDNCTHDNMGPLTIEERQRHSARMERMRAMMPPATEMVAKMWAEGEVELPPRGNQAERSNYGWAFNALYAKCHIATMELFSKQ